MYFILELIILLEFYAISQSKAYVLPTTQQDYNGYNSDLAENHLTELGIATPSLLENNNMITVVKPSDIKLPSSLQEIVNYIGTDKLSHTAKLPIEEENRHTLTYTELSKLLAFWQWAKEQNFYEMQTDQPYTNDNFVTIK